ncbi:MAG: SUMF1/EgtB/PvdO family nonheme iron enzyme [Planctomycetota bacterium]
MALVPAGSFSMGSATGRPDEQPIRQIDVTTYYIDKYEVTIADLRRFAPETATALPDWVLEGADDLPAAGVTFYEAAAYARWAGKSLPTEVQWEKAARGPKSRPFPWGDEPPDASLKPRASFLGSDPDAPIPARAPVGSFPAGANPSGCQDLAGNVWEWCADWYSWTAYELCPPSTPAIGARRIIRGGSYNNIPFDLRASSRGSMEPFARGGNVGFRCVLNLTRPQLDAQTILQTGYEALGKRLRCQAEDAALTVLDADPADQEGSRLLEETLKLQPPGYVVAPDSQAAPGTHLPTRILSLVDGAILILIPAGEFGMGSDDGLEDERPEHMVYLDAYYIDATPITNALWEQYMRSTRAEAPFYWGDPRLAGTDKPVIGVTYKEALNYARWAGRRLPTEAEWEKPARPNLAMYPWGNGAPDATGVYRANYAQRLQQTKESLQPPIPPTQEPSPATSEPAPAEALDGFPWTSPVDAFPSGASPYGVLDLAGNVWEWCADWYDSEYYRHAPSRNPPGPKIGSYRVLRGGAFNTGPQFIRSTARFYSREDYPYGFTGVRLAASAP